MFADIVETYINDTLIYAKIYNITQIYLKRNVDDYPHNIRFGDI